MTNRLLDCKILWLVENVGMYLVSTKRFEVSCSLSGGCHVPPQSAMTNISANPLAKLRAALAMEQASMPALVPVLA